MIPTLQMIPTPMIPFVSLFDPNSGQYLGQISPYNFSCFQGMQVTNSPLNFYSSIPTTTAFTFFNESKSSDNSFAKSTHLSSELKNRSDNSSTIYLI